MSIKSSIEWTDATWAPVTGCDPISPGCKHCYAKREVEQRWSKNPKSVWFGRTFNDVQCHMAALEQPLHWKKPRKIFVCPRSDLFHDAVPDKFISDVFGVMASAPQHTFQVLTKRSKRARDLLGAGCMGRFESDIEECMALYTDRPLVWPLPNVHLGVSVENQGTADERIPMLLQTPAAVRWISAEPLLGPIDLAQSTGQAIFWRNENDPDRRIDWVVVGGESGLNARPMHPEWARSLRDQCSPSGVPILFKQWGEWYPAALLPQDTALAASQWAMVPAAGGRIHTRLEGPLIPSSAQDVVMGRIGIRKAGRVLDDRLHDAYPEVI